MTDSTPGAVRDHGHAHLGWALVLICTAQLMVVLDSTIANIALPYIQADLDVSQANLQWVVTGYALTFGGLLLLGGRLGDLYGRRRLFMIGLAVFAIASGLGGFAQNELMLLMSRGLQGVGAAIASPTALALITTTFPPGAQRQRAFGVYAAMAGIGAAVGLILGGWLTGLSPDFLGHTIDGWRLTFLINVPIGVLAALAAPAVLGESEPHPGELDVPGAFAGTFGLISIVYGLTRAAETDTTGGAKYGWTDPGTLLALGVGVALLALFVLIESRVEHPLVPFRLLRSRTRATAFVTMGIVPAAMFAMFFFLSLFVQNVMGYSPLRTGVAFLPFTFGMVAAAMTSAKLLSRIDPRFIAGTGTILAGLSLLMFSRLSVDDSPANLLAVAQAGGNVGDSVNYWTSIFPWIITMSFGMGLTFMPMTLSAVHGVAARDSGVGSGVLNTMQQVGGAMGLATLSTIAVHFSQARATELFGQLKAAVPANATAPTDQQLGMLAWLGGFTHGATHAFLTGAIMMWVASLIVWIFLNVKHEELAHDAEEHPEAGIHVG